MAEMNTPNFEWRSQRDGAMTRADALQVFMRNGVAAPESMTSSELRAAHQHLAWSNHPDLGGDIKKMQLINSAYAVLKKQMPGRHRRFPKIVKIVCGGLIERTSQSLERIQNPICELPDRAYDYLSPFPCRTNPFACEPGTFGLLDVSQLTTVKLKGQNRV